MGIRSWFEKEYHKASKLVHKDYHKVKKFVTKAGKKVYSAGKSVEKHVAKDLTTIEKDARTLTNDATKGVGEILKSPTMIILIAGGLGAGYLYMQNQKKKMVRGRED